MASTVESIPRSFPSSSAPPSVIAIPWHVWAVVFASTSVLFGVLWDISWHESIGRDTLWSPPHLAIYVAHARRRFAASTVPINCRTLFRNYSSS